MGILKNDPCGILCILITYGSIVYSEWAVVNFIILDTLSTPWNLLHIIVFNAIAALVLISHFKAMNSDPGTVPLPQTRIDFSDIHATESGEALLKNEEWTVCSKCETYRPPFAHHCRICRRCIKKMDHHCPWVNNCIGESNQLLFVKFLMCVALLVTYSSILLIVSFWTDCEQCSRTASVESLTSYEEVKTFHKLMLMVECSLYGLFTILILLDQIDTLRRRENPEHHANRRMPFHRYVFSRICATPRPLQRAMDRKFTESLAFQI